MKIGFIGLGIMGRPMAKNLLKAGYDVTVDSHSPAAAAELEACGAKVADQPTIGSTCDLVLTMLPNAPQVKQVMLGANGVAAHMQPGSTVMNAKAPMMIEGNDKPGFKIDLHIKDLNNALDCAHTVGAPVPMTAEVQEILQWLHSNGKGQADHSAIAQYYEHLTGIKLGRDL